MAWQTCQPKAGARPVAGLCACARLVASKPTPSQNPTKNGCLNWLSGFVARVIKKRLLNGGVGMVSAEVDGS